jgi:small subunit ribosomal protein S8e
LTGGYNMPEVHGESRRKKTGGLKRPSSKRKKRNIGGTFSATTIGNTATRQRDSRGNTQKISLKRTDTVSVATPDGETKAAEIEAVLENDANPDFVRRDILTKGTVLQTSEGKARVTSRPGQNGTLNAVLIDE